MEFEKARKDGTGTHLNPHDINLGAASTESTYISQIAYWDIKRGSDLAAKQTFPGLGERDLLPHVSMGQEGEGYHSSHTPVNPQLNKFYAIANRQDGMPLEMLEYTSDRSGKLNYVQQYLFRYQDMPDGQNRVTVQNWAPSDSSYPKNPKRTIGDQENMLIGISQYYRKGTETVKAEYWSPASMTAPPAWQKPGSPKATGDTRTPDVRLTFNDGTNDIGFQQKSLSGLLSGVIREGGLQAKNQIAEVLPKYSFYDLFGPKL